MKRHSDKEWQKLIDELAARGWVGVHGKKHYKMRSPGGQSITFPSSPSDRRAILNIKSTIRKIELNEKSIQAA